MSVTDWLRRTLVLSTVALPLAAGCGGSGTPPPAPRSTAGPASVTNTPATSPSIDRGGPPSGAAGTVK